MKIIAFSLWGDNPIYTEGAIKNADLASNYFPEWICRYYIGRSVPPTVVKTLEEKTNCQVIKMEEEGDWTGMFWRFYPGGEDDVDIMISRDCDSRLSYREMLAVNEWVESDSAFHIMRDHPYHTAPILGGMWGCKKGILINIKDHIQKYVKGDFWQVDQDFLKEIIYPIVQGNSLVHDEFFEKKPFPSPRSQRYFVGQAFDEYDRPIHPEHMSFF